MRQVRQASRSGRPADPGCRAVSTSRNERMSEVLPIRRDWGSYSPVCLRLFYSASDPTKRVRY